MSSMATLVSRVVRAERARGDLDVLSRAGLDLETFLAEANESLARAVPSVSTCVGTMDPSTALLTSHRKYGHMKGMDSYDWEWSLLEYGSPEPTSFTELARAALPTESVHRVTAGEIERSTRMGTLMHPNFGYADEARVVFREDGRAWGSMAIFRGPDDPTFDGGDLELLAAVSASLARGVRGALLCSVAARADTGPTGPAVVILDERDQVVQVSLGAEVRLAQLREARSSVSDDVWWVIGCLVAAARRYARGESEVPARSRVRGPDGRWMLMHAAALSGAADRAGEVVVTIEEARPAEVIELVVAAFGLTVREREVTELVLQGLDTKEIAAQLYLSAYTVQDHLKSVFEKADVRSRRELVSRIYVDQYVPRRGAELAPTGFYA